MLWILCALLAAPSGLIGSEACRYRAARGLEFGRDAEGYFVRITSRVQRGAPYQTAIDYLAGESQAVPFYIASSVPRDLATGQWRARDPLTCARGFAAAAGLRVISAKRDIWIVEPAELPDRALTMAAFAQSLGTVGALSPARQGVELEKALLRQLPVRDLGGTVGQTLSTGVSYYDLSSEAPGAFLVIGSASAWTEQESSTFKIFKVRTRPAMQSVGIECVWETTETAGHLVQEVVEDFDGDGLRDFLFDAQGTDGVSNFVVVSGATGTRLFAFNGDTLAVERVASGPRRVGVPRFIRRRSYGWPESVTGSRWRGPGAGPSSAVVLT